jgi:cytochrome P450
VKSNAAADLPPEQRISDEDILHNINTFMFAGSDTTSLALTWTLLLLAQNPALQTRLRNELLSVAPALQLSSLTSEELESFHETLSNLPYLHNVCRESLRVIPPVHSSLRVATQDDEVPTSYPVHIRTRTGCEERKTSVSVPKGSFVHIPVEGFNLDTEIWGSDAWEFKYDCFISETFK